MAKSNFGFTKSEAKQEVRRLRRKGHKARIVEMKSNKGRYMLHVSRRKGVR